MDVIFCEKRRNVKGTPEKLIYKYKMFDKMTFAMI